MGFFLIILAVTFYAAFEAVQGDETGGEPAGSETPPATSTGGPPGNEVAVSMGDNFFDPERFAVPAGQAITIDLTNDGAAIHNMHIAGPDGEYDTDDDAVSDPEIVPGGQNAVVNWQSPPAPGESDFRCDFHPTQMTGTITVQ